MEIEQAVPGSTFPCSPLAKEHHPPEDYFKKSSAKSFAEDTEGGRVRRAWRGRTVWGGPVALRRAGASWGML